MALALVVVLVINHGHKSNPPDPIVQGQPVSAWVGKALRTGDYQGTQKLRELGPSVVPHLTGALQTGSTVLNTAWVKVWPYVPARIQQRMRQPVLAREIRLRAVVALREIGPAGKAGIPDLVQRLGDPDRQIRLPVGSKLKEDILVLSPGDFERLFDLFIAEQLPI